MNNSNVSNSDSFGDSNDVSDSDVFTRDKRVNIDIETIWVFFISWLPSESFMQLHESAKSFTHQLRLYMSDDLTKMLNDLDKDY